MAGRSGRRVIEQKNKTLKESLNSFWKKYLIESERASRA
jgi:hypothetical protein